MIKVDGDNLHLLDRSGKTIQTFTRISGVPPHALYDATGVKEESNMSIHEIEDAIVNISKEIAMKEARR